MIEKVIRIAQKAGQAIMEIYQEAVIEIEVKSDDSPLTKADLASNTIIIDELSQLSDDPIVSEETPVEYQIRKQWNRYWLVDPLDGTKDFIAKNGEFTINIALIENNKPILGVIYIPANGDLYYAQEGLGAFKNGNKIFNHSKRTELIGSDSNFHSTEAIKVFFKKNQINDIKKYGSAIKFCKLAEGEIDIYPRLNGTKEWDTAAGQIIANESGCFFMDVTTGKELVYNKESIVNNHFIAMRNNLMNTIEY